FVGDANLDRRQTVEHIQLGDGQAVDAVDLHRAFECDQVDPAAAARTPGGRAEFVAAFAQRFAGGVVEFGGKRAAADARRVRLADAEHVVDVARAHAGAGAGATDGGVGRGHERIGAVVDVEQRALRAFKKYTFAVFAQAMQRGGDVVDHRLDVVAE